MDCTPNLGHAPAADARRDCVHVAVAPVRAARRLNVSMPVWLTPDGEATPEPDGDAPVGVVDPFRLDTDVIEGGETCWLLLFPGTITGLRHVWTSARFPIRIPKVAERP